MSCFEFENIRRSSDRGFVPYSGCKRVCGEMMFVMQLAGVTENMLLNFSIRA
ncbi:hypothetical protein [Sporomusa malonica]|uniref:hypothetical protein n=1 Tax=Sporomusa malonica TaxID=112901 RepID=UPI00159349E5|nr:hypothetical protein [Sporomusa malonica]